MYIRRVRKLNKIQNQKTKFKLEVCSVIRFIHANGELPAAIPRQNVSVYRKIMNRRNVA